MITIEKIMEVLELGHKPDGKSFYSNEDKSEMLLVLFKEKDAKMFDKGWDAGYDKGWNACKQLQDRK